MKPIRKLRRAVLIAAAMLFLISWITRMWSVHSVNSSLPTISPAIVNHLTTWPDVKNTPKPRFLIGQKSMSAGRLGNDMFVYASVLGIAVTNDMTAIYRSENLLMLFELAADTGPTSVQTAHCSLAETSLFCMDSKFDDVTASCGGRVLAANSVTAIGLFQSWKYFWNIRSVVRKRLRFRENFRKTATSYLRNIGGSFDNDVVYVGVHIRRTDLLEPRNVQQGFSVADDAYLERAVVYIKDQLRNQRDNASFAPPPPRDVVFVVCSDDITWSKEHFSDVLGRTAINAVANDNIRSVRAVYYEAGLDDGLTSGGQDMAILSQCNHTIMTVGTFGWWAGYLAGGIVVYYKDFIRPGTSLRSNFCHEDFYPPEWIGL